MDTSSLATRKKQHIEKFKGNFSDIDGGCTVFHTKTLQSLTDVYELAFYSYLSSKPEDWKINHKELMNHFNLGKNKTYQVLNALITKRLVEKEEPRISGKYHGVEYRLYLSPFPTEREPVLPVPTKGEPAKPFPVKRETYKEEKLPYKEENRKKGACAFLNQKQKTQKDSANQTRPSVHLLLSYQEYTGRIKADKALGLIDNNLEELNYEEWRTNENR